MAGLITSKPRVPDESGDETTLPETAMLGKADFTGAAILSVFATVASAVLVFANANKYIELADQSLYLLMTDDPRAAIRSPSGFHVLLAPLWALAGESVIGFRILRAILDIGVDVILGISLLRYLRGRNNGEVFAGTAAGLTVVFSVTLSGFAVWIYAVNGFGYDQLGGIIFTLLVSVLLWLVGSESRPSTDALLAALVGGLFVLAVIVRWTAAVGSAPLLIWPLVEHFGWRKTRSLIGAGVVGAAGSLALIHFAVLDVGVLFRGLISGTSDLSGGPYSPAALLSRYALWLQRGIFAGSGLILATALSLLFFKRLGRSVGFLLVIFAVASQVVILTQLVFRQPQFVEANTWGTYLAFTCGSAVLVLLASGWGKGGFERLRGLSIPVALLALPVLLAVGSFLPVFLTALPLATFWVAGLWVTLPSLPAWRGRGVALVAVGVMLAALPWLLNQSLANPARTRFAENPVEVTSGRFEGLWVDETTQELLHDLEALRQQVGPEPTVISFWVRPVVPFALEGTGLGFPWYSLVNGPEAAAETISGACLEDGDTPTGDVVLVTESDDPASWGPIRQGLIDCGINFPEGFELVTTMVAPEPLSEDNIELSVYVREAAEFTE